MRNNIKGHILTLLRRYNWSGNTPCVALTALTVLIFLLASDGAASASTACVNEGVRADYNSTLLPDCRVYEMVSPADKNGAEIEEGLKVDPLIQASAEGGAITYGTINGAIENEPAGADEEDRVLSVRGAGGWTSKDIATSHRATVAADAPREFLTFSSNLASATVIPRESELQVTSEPISLRDNSTETYAPLVTSANVAPTERQAIEEHGALESKFEAATPDGSHIVFSSPENLTGNAPDRGLFEWSSGQLSLVSVLPGGTEAAEQSNVGGGPDSEPVNVRGAISDNGSRIVWQARVPGISTEERNLYLRDVATGSTAQVNAPQAVPPSTEQHSDPFLFQLANSEGTKVFFTENKKLTPNATPLLDERPDLYVYDADAPEGARLTDLTVDEHAEEHADVLGTILGGSEDGAYVYFVANGVLASGATPGDCHGEEPGASPAGATCNLYVAREAGTSWTTTFIASLSVKDGSDWLEGQGGHSLAGLTSRVSPNGNYLAFMSQRSLTGYDNTDAVTGEPDEEVYLYDAATERITCASCNPRGARPVGIYDSRLLVDLQSNWIGHWLAGSLPGWSGPNADATHQPRYLSNSGRLFFDSPEAYVPQDTNGIEDVYEYEPEGVGDCGSGSGYEGTSAYGGGGCLALISGGTGDDESSFMDASESGNDAFFVTSQSLVPADRDTNFDMYDAHVCSAQSECQPAPAESLAPCATAEACRPGAPALTVFASPTSIAVQPEKNVKAAVPVPVAKVKVLRHSVHDMTITLKVEVPAKGGIVAYGAGLKTTKISASGANTYTLHVKLSVRAAASLRRQRKYGLRHKRKLTVRVRFVPASGRASQVSVLAMVKA